MATIDSRFICTSDLEELMVDNQTGLPLSGGIVTFYSDVNRTVLKPVYQLSGTPGNYVYNPLPDPCVLSSAGTFQDALGNNIVPYYYPFVGTPDQNSGVQELYYITVLNSGFVPQFVRQAWPPSASAGNTPISPGSAAVVNFIPNGQFLSHNNIVSLTEPPAPNYMFNAESVNSQQIAQGGWNFVYHHGTASIFNNSFTQIPDAGGFGINRFPSFIFNFVAANYVDGATNSRDLRIQWPDVNKFSTGNPPAVLPTNPPPTGSIQYTLFFDARSNDGNTYIFTLNQIYYYGNGGSNGAGGNAIVKQVAMITVGPSATFVSQNIQNITFLANQGTVSGNGDDYVALSIQGPIAGSWNVSFTDFALVQGNQTLKFFPVQPNADMLAEGVAGWMPTPNPNGQDLYLPLVLTPQGMVFDHSIVGQIIGKTQLAANAVNNELLMDGSTYVMSAYSTLGIPYSRLANYLIANSPAYTVGTSTIPAKTIPLFGTGANFVTIWNNVDPTKFDLNFNTAGANAVNNQTSGFTHTSADPLYVFTVPAVPTAGTYFSFTPVTGGLVFNVYFTVNGVGTPPTAPTGANILVALVTADTVATTIRKIIVAVDQYQFMLIDARGYFWRGLDTGATIDPDAATRTSPGVLDNATAAVGANLGSLEAGAFLSHVHAASNTATTGQNNDQNAAWTFPECNDIALAAGVAISITTTIAATGGSETRPVNLALNWFIRY